ncbi:MAG: hypothetical protein M3Z27_02135 [Actinomycetota bacterium]|nr:hypothetical protein [Actinomycetota bacterium]
MRSDPAARAALLEELTRSDRLVLLGDLMELRHAPVAAALRAAEPVLAQIGSALGTGAEVVLVPGNHDHHLLEGWYERYRGAGDWPPALEPETPVQWREGEPLAAISLALAPARLRVSYPGTWLREDIFATHGHFVDRHTTVPMLERLAAGVMARVIGEPAAGPGRIEDYEAVLAPVYAWIHAVAQAAGPKLGRGASGGSAGAWHMLTGVGPGRGGLRAALRRRSLIVAFPVLIAALNRAGVGPLRRQLSAAELRRAPLQALGEVLGRLGISAGYVIFGHTHRAGPLAADDAAQWRGLQGQRLMNTGSWLHEPALMGSDPRRSPYRGGWAVRIADAGAPQLVNLCEHPAAPAQA